MKNYYILIVILINPIPITAQVGCIDNKEPLGTYDNKTYHYVACNCPCDAYRAKGLGCADRNKCIECGHFHYPRPTYFINPGSAPKNKEFSSINFQIFIDRYKERQNHLLNRPEEAIQRAFAS